MSVPFTHGQSTLGYPLLGDVITAAKSQDVLGISDRNVIISYIHRAIEKATWKCSFDPMIGDMDICSDGHGHVTVPSEVSVVLACNVGGFPAMFRNSWFQYHINGPGSPRGVLGGVGVIGPACQFAWEDNGYSSCFQDIESWSYLAAFVEDPIDGNGSLQLQVFGDTMDPGYNEKAVITVPPTGPSQPGIFIPLLNGWAATDAAATQLRRVTRVIKPVTRGYVKLIAFPGINQAPGRTIGYYAPNETAPMYRRLRVNAKCEWVRIKYRRSEIRFVYDTDIIPLPSMDALIDLLKAVRKSDKDQPEESEKYVAKAVNLLLERQLIEVGPPQFQLQVDPSFGIGTIDWR